MATTLAVNERIIGGGRISDPATLQVQPAVYGRGVLPARAFTLTNGTGSGQANKQYLARRTLAATTYDLLDLAGGLTDFQGNTLTFTAVKRVLVMLVAPNGTDKLYVGPQNQTHACQFGFGGVGATVYETVWTELDWKHPYAGWTIGDGATDVLPVYNPTAGSLDYAIWILGK